VEDREKGGAGGDRRGDRERRKVRLCHAERQDSASAAAMLSGRP
jgi:hypothetical protein